MTNQRARSLALSRVSPALNLAAPSVSFQSAGRLLVMGPEHRVRLACASLDSVREKVGLITEAMPETLLPEMEAAAELVPELDLYRLPLLNIEGYLGRFQVQVQVKEQVAPLARLAFDSDYFDTVLDLGATPALPMILKPAGYFAPESEAAYQTALAEIPALKGGFEKPRYFQVQTDLCAHSGSELTGCTRCLDLCPADAIRSRDGRIEVDNHLCHGAGGCATACPTGAIRYGYPQPQLLLERLQGLIEQYRAAGGVDPCLLIHDAAQGREQVAAVLGSLAGHWLPLEVEEAGSAGLEVWLSALALGVGEVALLTPASVPASIRATLEEQSGLANALVEALGLSTPVRLIDSLEQWVPSEAPKRTSLAPMAQLDAKGDKRSQVLAALEHLQQQAQVVPAPLALPAGAPFGGVLLDQSGCTLCGACAGICPTAALKSYGDQPRLSFTEADCVQCGLCVQACPEQVLQLQPRYLFDASRSRAPQVLKEEQPFCCIRCDKPFATASAIERVLEKLAGHSMFDEAGLRRLKMCADCRVVDMMQADPGGDLFDYARGGVAAKTAQEAEQ